MSFRAFVVGADYHLQFARADAEQIAAALENLGYELPDPRIPPPEEDKKSVLERLEQFATACGPEDTLLFYFAGHGVIEEGLLFLVLEKYAPEKALETCLMWQHLSGIFQISRAGTKLMILDCCHAGKSFSHADFNFSDSYAILTASESFERAFEFKSGKAGFLSGHLHKALTDDREQIARNSRISLNTLRNYVQKKRDEHNSSHPEKRVPEIILVGKQSKDIVFADIPADLASSPVFGLQRINRAFLAAERCKTGPNFTPAHFYRATPDVQWWGVANDLLSEQSLFPEVLAHVRRAVSGSAPLIGLLFGSGGMGKSILLRRLGAALSEEFAVWWVDSTEDVLQDRAAAEEKLLESDKPPLVLLDDWTMALQDEERKGFQAWFGQLYRSGAGRQIKFILTARNWNSDELPAKLLQDGGSSRFDLDKRSRLEQDNLLLLDKAAEKLDDSAWTAAAQELRSSNLARTKPFHLLFVLMRGKQVLAGQNVKGVFEEIIQSDLDKLWLDDYKKGLAAAVSTMAYFYVKFHRNLSRKAFLLLADRHNPHYPLAPFAEWPAPLHYYLHSYRNSVNKREDAEEYVGFIKDDFAKNIIDTKESKSRRHAENCWFADAEWLIQEADVYSASKLLYMICHKMPEVWTATQKKAMIRSQLECGNGHHAYAWLLLKDGIFADEAERWELIKRYLELSPKNFWFAIRFLSWGKKSDPERTRFLAKRLLEKDGLHPFVIYTALTLLRKDEAKLFARELLEKGRPEHQLICTALNLLGKEEAKPFAKKLLEKDRLHPFVICAVLNLLSKDEAKLFARKLFEEGQPEHQLICTALNLLGGEEAKPFAKKLLEKEGQEHQVICTALNLLGGEEAKPFAKKLLEKEGQEHQVICTALNLLGKDEAKPFARKLLEQDGQYFQIICNALRLLDIDEAKPFAEKILEQDDQRFEVICTALIVLGEGAVDYAAGILEKWQQNPFKVVLRCLSITPASRQAENIISFILKNKRNQFEYFRILSFPFHTIPAWQEETRRIISTWKHTSRQTVADVLRHYLDDPFLLNKPCFEILSQWKYDIEYQRKNFSKTICTDHILTALGHPHLRTAAARTAAGMLLHEKEQPGFLGEKLLQAAEAIVNDDIYPDWEQEAD